MNRWLIPAIAGVAALGIGFGIGAVVYGNDDEDGTTAETDVASTPDDVASADPAAQQTCLAALDAAEQDVEAEERTAALLERYQSVLNEGSEALAEFDTRRLEQLLTEVEALNRRSQELVDDSRDADISSAIETCRSVLGAT